MTPPPAPEAPAPPPAAPLPAWTAPSGAGELVVAVDTGSLDEALRLRDRLAGAANHFKIGKELFTAAGPEAVTAFAGAGRVFLDLKFHDIPATVAGAVRSAVRLGASIVDVHASGGRPMLEAAARAAAETPPSDSRPSNSLPSDPRRADSRPLLLAVTVLTHFDPESAAEVFPGAPIADQVLRLARLAAASGLDGAVASAAEAATLRESLGDDFVLLVPGVRPAWASATHDQRRVATPAEAARRGANYLVVGRAITKSPDPRAAALRLREEVASAGDTG